MKILFLTIGNENVASSRARVYGYLPFLAEKNIKYKVLSFTSDAKCRRIINLRKDTVLQRLFEISYKARVLFMFFILSLSYDVLFVQKIILPKPVWNASKLFNKQIVFDLDDAIYIYKDIKYILESAACVIVSNKNLKDVALKHNRNVRELISPVTANESHAVKSKESVTMGWTGSPETSVYLYSLIPVFKDLKKRFRNLNIILMGATRDIESEDIKVSQWSLDEEKNFLDNIDIGIMPLKNDEWSSSKAGYKLLLYMSRGVPCVASPVGINNEIIKDGVSGYLAGVPEEWSKKLSLLIEDRTLREKLGREALKKVEKFYSYKVCAPRMLDILAGVQPINRKSS